MTKFRSPPARTAFKVKNKSTYDLEETMGPVSTLNTVHHKKYGMKHLKETADRLLRYKDKVKVK